MKVPRSVSICGIEHEIIFIGPRKMRFVSGVAESFGCVDPDNPIIYLAESLRKKPTLLRDTLVHEVCGHALWAASGLGWWLRGQMKHKARSKAFYEFQEVFVRIHTPAVITTLRSLGLLKDSK